VLNMRISSFIFVGMTLLTVLALPAMAKGVVKDAVKDMPKADTAQNLKVPDTKSDSKAITATKLMVYGDSLSAGYGINVADGWVALMQNKLRPQGIEVVNASISGETTSGGLSRIKSDLTQHKPGVVLFALGANDGLRGLAVKETRKNMSAMISAAKAANAKVIVIGIQIPPNYGLDYATQFRDLYAELAKQHKVALVPFLLDGVAEKLELFQADRLHPIAAAQPRILENVLPVVEKMLNEKTSTSASSAQSTVKSTKPAKPNALAK
jgi:acyl-CoA thioesterase I